MTKKEIQKLADIKYPIIPQKFPNEDTGEICNNDEMLENFRLSIESISRNQSYIEGYIDAQNHIYNKILAYMIGTIIGLMIGFIIINLCNLWT